MREILHINTDDFFASVVKVKDRRLDKMAVIIGNMGCRGSVISASYEARGEGIRPGMPIWQARYVCPGAVFIQADWNLYYRVSRYIHEVINRFSPQVEYSHIDEAYIDYTGCRRLLGHPLDACVKLSTEIKNKLNLDVSIGFATNKLVSRIASSAAKRAGIVDVFPGYEASFLAPFPVERLPGINVKTGNMLRDMGITKIGALAALSPMVLEKALGYFGILLHQQARGFDPRPVRTGKKEESIHTEVRLESDTVEIGRIDSGVFGLSEKLGRELRIRHRLARRLKLTLVYADKIWCEAADLLPIPTDLDEKLYRTGLKLLSKTFKRRVRVREIKMEASRLFPDTCQRTLFDEEGRDRARDFYGAVDKIRTKYGNGKVCHFGKALLMSENV